MKIEVQRKKKEIPSVTLKFKKTNLKTSRRKIPIVSIYDEKNEHLSASLKLTQIQSRIPSTLLSRWINANFAEKLLELKDYCHTVEHVKNGKGKWYFTNKPEAIYGLHKLKIKEDGHTYRVIKIDDGISMQAVKNILNTLDIEIECEYDVSKQRMLQITLKGDVI